MAGRPTKFSAEIAEKIYFLARKGFVDREIAFTIGVNEETLNRWKKSKGFATALKNAKHDIDERVEQALLKRALGYTYEETTQERIQTGVGTNGEPIYRTVQKVTRKEIPPDVGAERLWLINRRPDRWADKRDGLTVPITNDNRQIHFHGNPDDIVQQIKEQYGDSRAIALAQSVAHALGIPLASGHPTTAGAPAV